MINCYAFTYPKSAPTSFKLVEASTVAYIDDSIFYQLDFNTGKAIATIHPQGRSYQAFTTLHKRGMTVLADYGKSSNLTFNYKDPHRNFQMKDVCPLQILQLQLSLDGKYLAVACGSPTFRILFINVEERKIMEGSHSYIDIKGREQSLVKINFNPTNKKIVSLSFQNKLEVYEIKDCLQVTENGIDNSIIVIPTHSVEVKKLEESIWDELGNVYIAAENRLWVWSSETGKEIASYDIQQEGPENLVRSLLLTQKHIIAFYSNGRAEWLIKYYPELLDEDSTSKPFQLDRYYEHQKKAVHALYDHTFQKILLAFDDGFMGVLNQPADKYPEDDEEPAEGAKNNKEAKLIEADNSFFGPYHRSRIILIHQIAGTCLVVTLSINGRVILWSAKERKQKGFFDIDGEIISADINNKSNILAVCKSDGLVQFYSISSFDNPFLFKQFRMTKGTPLDQVTFSSSGDELAVLSKNQSRIYYLLTSLDMPFEVLGYVCLPHNSISMSWHATQKKAVKPKHEYLLVCIGYGVLVINGPAAIPTKKRGKELNLQVQIYALRTDLNQYLVNSLPSGQIITTGEDKFIKKYRQPQELLSKVDFYSKFAMQPPLEEYEAHDLKITAWNKKGSYLVSGSADGSIHLRNLGNFNSVESIQAAGWKEEGIGFVAPSSNGGVYVGAVSGCFQVWQTLQIALSDEHKVQEASFKRLPKDRETKYFQVMIEQEYLQRMKEVLNNKKKVHLQKLEKIRTELHDLVIENEKHDQLERLTRDELAVDLESRDRIDKIGHEKCLKIREESRQKILKNQIITKKLKQITWDRMSIHLKAINGLKNNYIMFNYQIRKLSRQEKRMLQIIFDLRRAQKKEQKKHEPQLNYQYYSNKNVVNGGIVQPLILNSLANAEKKEQKKEEKGKKKKEEEQNAAQAQQTQEIFNEQEWALLYNSFELYSDNAKRNQIVMMKHLIIRIKETFNKEFEKILKLRQNQNDLINDKNKRIEEICQELKRPSEVIKPRKNILQSNDAILEVKPEEIPFKRYLSKEEREKVERERLKEEERLRKLAEDDSSKRALNQMMGGTLQEKKTSVLEMQVERQKWMDKPIEEMSEEQKVKMKEYEQKRQKAEEQKERIVKKLEAELRKLKMEIDDVMQKYDQKLFSVLKRKIEYDYRIEQQQLYCTRLFLTMSSVQDQQCRQMQLLDRLQKSKDKLQRIEQQKDTILQQEEEIQKAKEAKHASLDAKRLGDIESKIKTIEKSIFEEYQSNYKKRKEMQEKLLESQPDYHKLLVGLDPMKETESKNLAQQKIKDFHFFHDEIKILQQTYQIPEGSLFQILEHRFNIRKEEAELDQKVIALKDTLNILEERQQESEATLKKEQEELEVINAYLERIESDLQVQIRIKQGQVELNNDKPVPELQDALLISKSQIDEKNAKIILNANEKIKVMEQIKTCKISVTQQTLKLQKNQELIINLNNMIKEIQMLKVKKEMQVALAKKDTKMNQNQIKSLKEQIQKVRKEGEKRMTHFQKKIEKVAAEIETIKKQNKQLETQKWNLETTVKQREKIKEMMVGENGGNNQEAKEKFEQIAVNRKLFDKAKQQTQEIELLRQELSKLKAKTFANFSNATR